MSIRIEFAGRSDFPAIFDLLGASGLPVAGLGDHVGTLVLAAKERGRVLGCAALELYGKDALLRSVAVAEDARGGGLGDRITRYALDTACRLGVRGMYLLTEGAEGFFARHGFEPIERQQVPAALAQSVEFASVVCASAVAMAKQIKRRPEKRYFGSGYSAPRVTGVSLRDLAATSGVVERQVKTERQAENCASCG